MIDRKSAIDPLSSSGNVPEHMAGFVEFKDVSFTYPTRPDAHILTHFNLQIKEGQVVALVGQSGCGKSSTIALLERFYDPQEGEILIGGADIKTLNVKWLRQHVRTKEFVHVTDCTVAWPCITRTSVVFWNYC